MSKMIFKVQKKFHNGFDKNRHICGKTKSLAIRDSSNSEVKHTDTQITMVALKLLINKCNINTKLTYQQESSDFFT